MRKVKTNGYQLPYATVEPWHPDGSDEIVRDTSSERLRRTKAFFRLGMRCLSDLGT
jgi:hypothetical protein